MKLVQFTDTEGRPIWVNPDAVALLEEDEPGKTTLYFANADIPVVVIRGFAEKVVDALAMQEGAEARADISMLQATGRLPTDEDLSPRD